MKPRLLDLFAGAGGAATGYHRAGFEVVGVDVVEQPNYPFECWKADALDVLDRLIRGESFGFGGDQWYLGHFAAIHASPPCQSYSALHGLTTKDYPALIEPVRDHLETSELPYVIENVVGAPLRDPIRLCGSSFGLGVWRHRLFEMSHPPALVPPCSHREHPAPIDVTGTGGPSSKPRTSPGGGLSRKPRNLDEAGKAMGINWMSRREMVEAIPPAMTEFVGHQLLAVVNSERAVA